MRVRTHFAEFGNDLGRSLSVWRAHPWLPINSVVVFVGLPLVLAVIERPAGYWAQIAVGIATAGWVGTERMWYLRAFRSQTIRPRELLAFTRRFFRRYFILGVLALVPEMAFWLVLVPFMIRHGFLAGGFGRLRWELTVANLIPVVAVDVALTFVTPALAFTTSNVLSALRQGMRMIRQEWPASAPYTLVPPLALYVLARSLGFTRIGFAASLIALAVTMLVNLCFKGAVAAFYIRRVQVDT